MEKNKYCCRIFPVILIMVSFVIALAIWFLDDAKHSFSFLVNKNEIFNFIGTVLFIAVVPVGMFYWLNEKEKYESRAKAISLLGFLPAVVVLVFIVFL